MRKFARFILAGALVLAALVALVNEDDLLIASGFGAIALIVLMHGYWKLAAGKLVSAAKKLKYHSDESIRESFCSFESDGRPCRDRAYFLLIVTVDDIHGTHDPAAGNCLRCCRQHHPFRATTDDRGARAHETLAALRRRNLTIERIHMIMRLYG